MVITLPQSSEKLEKKATQMDCNKDKAIRAKEAAENMFNARDIVGAMRHALKARSLFPSLEGIVEMVVTFSVYISAMTKINGETAWYGVLKVDPMADDDTLRKQYSKLSFMLHPDNKNKSIGADGAFSLVSQAWSVLSDKAKRVAYDEKIKGLVCSFSTECADTPEQTEANFTRNIAHTAAAPAGANTQNRTDAENSFWTVCHHCISCYHYSRAFVNRRLVCHVCHKPFFAVEFDRPVRDIYSFVTPRKFIKTRRDIGQKLLADRDLNWSQDMNGEQNFSANSKFSCSPLVRTSGASSADRAANVVMKITEKLKRRREEEEEDDLVRKWKEASLEDVHVSKKGYFSPVKVSKALENLSLSSYNGEAPEILVPSNIGEKFIAMGSFRAELQNRRVEMDIEEISRKLEELHHDKDGGNEAGEEEYLKCEDTCDESNIGRLEERLSGSQETKAFASTDMAAMVAENFGKMSIDVSDCVLVKEADNVEELINDIGILGEEKKKMC